MSDTRQQRNRADLDVLFSPRGIAIIGATPDKGRAGGQPLHYLREFGYEGGIYPVNPKYQDIDGVRCYPDPAAVPKPCDVAVIALNATHVDACDRTMRGGRHTRRDRAQRRLSRSRHGRARSGAEAEGNCSAHRRAHRRPQLPGRAESRSAHTRGFRRGLPVSRLAARAHRHGDAKRRVRLHHDDVGAARRCRLQLRRLDRQQHRLHSAGLHRVPDRARRRCHGDDVSRRRGRRPAIGDYRRARPRARQAAARLEGGAIRGRTPRSSIAHRAAHDCARAVSRRIPPRRMDRGGRLRRRGGPVARVSRRPAARRQPHGDTDGVGRHGRVHGRPLRDLRACAAQHCPMPR